MDETRSIEHTNIISWDAAQGLVSIVMPVYNVAPYVERCLLSVMGQTFPAAECIIVNDASTDDSINRCMRLVDD